MYNNYRFACGEADPLSVQIHSWNSRDNPPIVNSKYPKRYHHPCLFKHYTITERQNQQETKKTRRTSTDIIIGN